MVYDQYITLISIYDHVRDGARIGGFRLIVLLLVNHFLVFTWGHPDDGGDSEQQSTADKSVATNSNVLILSGDIHFNWNSFLF